MARDGTDPGRPRTRKLVMLYPLSKVVRRGHAPTPAPHGLESRGLKLYSERLFLKWLISNFGICFGIDMKRSSYLFLISKRGILLRRRPVGDKVVENLDYEIPQIVVALQNGE